MRMGPQLKVSPDRLEKPEIEPATPVYKASGLSTTPQKVLVVGHFHKNQAEKIS